METYTMYHFENDGYFKAKPGQYVTSEVVKDITEYQPMNSLSAGEIVQCREPHSHIFYKSGSSAATYLTFFHISGDLWRYIGDIPRISE